MTEAALDRVTALDAQAFRLSKKTHFARCADKFGEAATAAKALGFEDCLIVAMLQADELDARMTLMGSPGVEPIHQKLALANVFLLLTSLFDTLRRRRDAGTLLAGACRPAEVAWNKARQRARDPHGELNPYEWMAPFIGYDAYLTTAAICTDVIALVCATGAEKQSKLTYPVELAEFVASAVELLVKPRLHSEMLISAEMMLVRGLGRVHDGRTFNANKVVHQLLMDAWGVVQHSDVLRERNIDNVLEFAGPHIRGLVAKGQERYAAEAPALRTCALEGCGAREIHVAQFKKCAACQAVVYCCREHQVEHWKAHKKACKAARKATAS